MENEETDYFKSFFEWQEPQITLDQVKMSAQEQSEAIQAMPTNSQETMPL